MTRWFDEKHNCTVVFVDFPEGIDEFVTENADGSYTVFIAKNRCQKRMEEAFRHALTHIERGDLEDGVNVQEAERIVHEIA